ncbi:peptidoglycan-binding protein [Desulfitobacterium sp. THU1]|uniref:PGRP and LysM peptidoglycan-binding domain-containing protein n=1 Tax=Desulfitobacterium sp. THU1 TaxID=3138072 RepID=UPI00311EFA1A
MERGAIMNYVVKPGETLFDIACMFNTTVEELLMLNPQISDPMCLFPGQVICVPTQPMHPGMPMPTPMPGQAAPCPTLRQGSTGPSVVHLQHLLTSHGFSPGAIDGIFGPKTEAAVIAFQQSRGLLVDGIVGVQTWTALGVNCMTPPPTQPCPTLRQGSTGPDVVRLQQLLTSHGFSPGAIDGIFGPKTEAAVIAFQRSRGLLVDGIVGVQTWSALGVNCMTPPPHPQPCPTLRQGSTGPDVVRLQQLLTSHGFSPGAIDGIFGPKTEAAVIAFQRSRGLLVDGIVGVQTWTALGVTCTTPPPPPPTQPCPTLRMGSRGPAVRELQTLLTSQGFSPGPIDGIFGSKTQAAVIAFQKSKGLVQDGIVGIKTWTALGVKCR